MKSRVTVSRAYKVRQGAVLSQALTGTWTNGSSLQVEAATDFSPDGGDGWFKTDPDADTGEYFTYGGIEINGSDNAATPDLLLGVQRNAPVSHAKGTWVQDGLTETVEKHVDGYVDGSAEILAGVPVDPVAYTLIELGIFAEADMPVLPMEIDDTGNSLVTGGAIGSVPLVGADIETLPGTGDGDGTVDPETGNPPPGQGWEDGLPPATAPTITAVGGVGFISVRVVTVENGSAVTYKVHCHTTNGFTPAANTLVGTVRLAGIAGFMATLTVKDFPTGHVLDGGANDPVKNPTVYYFQAIPADGSGDGPTSAQVSATPVLIASVDIGASVVNLATQVSGLLPNANLSQITDATKLADAIVTGAKIAAGTIDASTKVSAGTIVGNLIAAGVIASTHLAAGSVVAGKIAADAVTATEIAANSVTSSEIAANTIVAGDIAALTITAAEIAATTITADKLSVSTLSAISGNIGTITAGSLSAVTISSANISSTTITSTTVTSPSASPRGAASTVKLDSGQVEFAVQQTGGTGLASIQAGSAGSLITPANMYLAGTDVVIEASLKVDVGSASTRNLLELRTTGGTPAAPVTGRCELFYDGSAGANGILKARNPTSTQTVCTF